MFTEFHHVSGSIRVCWAIQGRSLWLHAPREARTALRATWVLGGYFISAIRTSVMSLFAQYPQWEMVVCPYSPLCQLGQGAAVAPFPRQTDRQTDTLTGTHWSHSSSGDQTLTASPELCCRALSLFVLITVIISRWGPLLTNHMSR